MENETSPVAASSFAPRRDTTPAACRGDAAGQPSPEFDAYCARIDDLRIRSRRLMLFERTIEIAAVVLVCFIVVYFAGQYLRGAL